MTLSRALLYVLWFLGPVLEAAIVILMCRRKLRREYPWFFYYMLLQLATFAVLVMVYHLTPGNYFAAYWTLEAFSVGLGLAVL